MRDERKLDHLDDLDHIYVISHLKLGYIGYINHIYAVLYP